MDMELPRMDDFRAESSPESGENNGGPSDDAASLTNSLRSSPLISSVNSSQSLISVASSSEMVTRASIRLERKPKMKTENDIYYFPSPNDKGKYPMDATIFLPNEKETRATTRNMSSDTVGTEIRSIEVLIR